MARAKKAGVVQQILTGDNMSGSKEIIELAHQYSKLCRSAGPMRLMDRCRAQNNSWAASMYAARAALLTRGLTARQVERQKQRAILVDLVPSLKSSTSCLPSTRVKPSSQ